MLHYVRRRWAHFSRLWKPLPEPTIPYYVVRANVESGFGRRNTIIDSAINVAIFLPIGFLLASALRQLPWWQIILVALVVFVPFAAISIALNLTADAMTLTDEDQKVQSCIDFIKKQKYTTEILDDIAALASLNSGSAQNRLSLPAVLLTAVATVAVIGAVSFGFGFTLGMLALLSLLSFAATTGEANADLIVQKAVLLVSREQIRERKARIEQSLLQDMLVEDTSVFGTSRI